MTSYFDVFDTWEPLLKARKAKGLSSWTRLQHIAHKLEDKTNKDITFTCCHPSHAGETHVLGSVAGTLHFLLGYGNPGFHMAPYHWQVIDPAVDDDQADELMRVKGHPSRPEFWKQAELDDEAEGDLVVGMPHPTATAAQEQARRENDGIRVASGSGVYLAVPSEGLVYGEHNGHVYTWDVVRASFMSAMNPSLVEAMDAAESERAEKALRKYGPIIPDTVKCHLVGEETFCPDVYALVKSLFPKPGSVIPLDLDTGETIYAGVREDSIQFFDRLGAVLDVEVYSNVYKAVDITRDGNIHPSVLYNFGLSYLGLDRAELEPFASSHVEVSLVPAVVKGLPTEGFNDVGATLDDLSKYQKDVVILDGTVRLVLTPNE